MRRYIKDYNGATMMECRIDKHIDYLGTWLAVVLVVVVVAAVSCHGP